MPCVDSPGVENLATPWRAVEKFHERPPLPIPPLNLGLETGGAGLVREVKRWLPTRRATRLLYQFEGGLRARGGRRQQV